MQPSKTSERASAGSLVSKPHSASPPAEQPAWVDSHSQAIKCATWGHVWVPARKNFGRVCIYCGCRS